MREIEGRPLVGKTIAVTGGRSGIGAELAVAAAEAGANVVINYVDPVAQKDKRTQAVEKRVLEAGVRFKAIRADITNPQDRQIFLQTALQFSHEGKPVSEEPKIFAAFWNAAGGLEEDKPNGWAELINTESTLALAYMFTPHIDSEGGQIYVTSVWAKRYGQVKQLPFYRPVARTKFKAEQGLMEMDKVGILSGHVVTGTRAYAILNKNFPDRMRALETLAEGGKFPEARDMGVAGVDMLIKGFHHGETRWVGGSNAEPIDPISLLAATLDRAAIRRMYPMYSDSRILVDRFDSPEENINSKGKELGLAEYTVRRRDVLGHFTGEYKDIRLWRGVDRIESAAQALGLTFLTLEPNSSFVPLFTGGEKYDFSGVITPGERVVMETELTAMTPRGLRGNVLMRVGDEKVTEIQGLRLGLAPDKQTARRLIQSQISKRQKTAQ